MPTAIITKWAETRTIEISEENLTERKDVFSHEPYVRDGYLCVRINGMWLSVSSKDWTLDYKEAERRWMAKRKRDIASLTKRIAKLEATKFAETFLKPQK